jgi:hypothetical protein
MTEADFTPEAIHAELLDYTVNQNCPDAELSELGSEVYITDLADIEVSSVTKRDSNFVVKGSATLEAYTDMGEGQSWDHSLPMHFTYEFDEDGKIVRQLRRSINTSSSFEPDDIEATFLESSGHLDSFEKSILKVISLLGEPISPPDKKNLYGLLYVNVITALECYLSDFFIARTKEDKKLLRKLIETTPAFREQKTNVSEVFKTMDSIEKRADTYLTGLVWHRLEQARRLYENVLSITFPSIKDLQAAIAVRHELVHRNGRKADGTEHVLTETDIRKVIKMEEELIEHIEKEWLRQTASSGTATP